jgi:16S rRNA processing protein RimM
VLLVADVDPQERPDDPDEFYDHQLVGLTVRTVAGEVVGTLAEVLHLPGQDVLAVNRPDTTQVLVPFVREIVPEVDLGTRTVLVDPPPGLLSPVDEDEA